MRYRKEFFEVQIQFARRVAEVCGIPLEQAILHYTNVYVRFAIGRGFDPAHPIWRKYVDGLWRASDPSEWTYQFYLTRPYVEPPQVIAAFGCFSYGLQSGDRIRLHFENRQTGTGSPLAEDRADARRDELCQLFSHVQRLHPGARSVAGVSWLYNLTAYRRQFPENYLASARVAGDRFRNMPLWGQFIDWQGRLKPTPVEIFRERLAHWNQPGHAAGCFPLQPLAVEAPITDFYRFHGLPPG